jgi:hypothetical protein
MTISIKKNLHGLSPQANYTDRATIDILKAIGTKIKLYNTVL